MKNELYRSDEGGSENKKVRYSGWGIGAYICVKDAKIVFNNSIAIYDFSLEVRLCIKELEGVWHIYGDEPKYCDKCGQKVHEC